MVLSGCVGGIGRTIFFSLSVLNIWYLHMKGVSGGSQTPELDGNAPVVTGEALFGFQPLLSNEFEKNGH